MTKNGSGWQFDNSYTRLPDVFYATVLPEKAPSPALIICNDALAKSIGLHVDALQSEQGIDELAGNKIPDGAHPIAQAYAGHQFGHFTMLGDGRAVLLGEQLTPTGERLDIQLKGGGPTPFSRGGDGRAGLGPMLREYIMSEAMHGLGIPTTRSLAVVVTGSPVYREEILAGAVLTRVAASHIRVGTFQYAAARQVVEDLQALADYTIERHYPTVASQANPYVAFFEEVMDRQAQLLAKWQCVGFIHGVMNTDNMAVSGETIDYGPCAFMDTYDPATVFSSIDRQSRYAFGNQPGIAEWNLARFAETLLPLFDTDTEKAVGIAEQLLSQFGERFHHHWLAGMRNKLGLFNEEQADGQLIKELLQLMQAHKADFTNTFRALTLGEFSELQMASSEEFKTWHSRWKERRARQEQSEEAVLQLMKNNNPNIIPRNHRMEEALDAATKGDLSVMEHFLAALKNPYAYTEDQKPYIQPADPETPYFTYCGT
ncbi:YdiU family protein [Sporosarcina saromensis]|uniref:Protein nucleotidyltransferase YdiU n=1 Tax=Sporosarcina saromensis TaxID=359365 RepID=A0ABU4G8I1_9BACL|nr:YdiU family protein [Sporosarcina saromensis]MDW0113293.1 YdiU family protein [Sporosarcina saromensis]